MGWTVGLRGTFNLETLKETQVKIYKAIVTSVLTYILKKNIWTLNRSDKREVEAGEMMFPDE